MFAILLLFMFVPGQERPDVDSAKFYVERVTVFSKYDSAFVLELSNSLLPPNREVSEADVQCLIAELEVSGLFERIKKEWTDSGKGIRRLALYCEPKPGREAFVLSRVSLVQLPEIDKKGFSRRLAEKGIKAGMPLLYYSYERLNEMVDDSIRKSVSPDLVRKYCGSAWLSFQPDGAGKIEMRVMAEKPQCPRSTSTVQH